MPSSSLRCDEPHVRPQSAYTTSRHKRRILGAVLAFLLAAVSGYTSSVQQSPEPDCHALAILGDTFFVTTPEDGLMAWGSNERGLLPFSREDIAFEYRQQILPDVQAVYASDLYVLALDASGRLYGWPSANQAALSFPLETVTDNIALLMEDVVTASAGFDYCAAVTEDGALWTWGRNQYGQLDMEVIDDLVHPPEKRMEQVASVCCGFNTAFAITTDHQL